MAVQSLPDAARVVRSKEILEAELDDEIVALDIGEGECYGFNAVASSIWRMLQNEMSVADIRASLEREFEVEPEVCQAEVSRILNEFASARLVEIHNA